MHVEKKCTYIPGTPGQFVSPDCHISQDISKTKFGIQLWFRFFWYILLKIPSVLTTNIFDKNTQYLLYMSYFCDHKLYLVSYYRGKCLRTELYVWSVWNIVTSNSS